MTSMYVTVEFIVTELVLCFSQELDKIDDPVEKDRQRSLKICKDINRVLLNALSSSVTHLSEIEFDVTPRHEAFWFVGGIEPPKPKKMNSWENWDSYKLPKVDPFDRGFQYAGKYRINYLINTELVIVCLRIPANFDAYYFCLVIDLLQQNRF